MFIFVTVEELWGRLLKYILFQKRKDEIKYLK